MQISNSNFILVDLIDQIVKQMKNHFKPIHDLKKKV